MPFCKNEFRKKNLGLPEHPESDFYLSTFQKSNSPVPLLIFRSFLFAVSVFILVYTLVVMADRDRSYFLIYMTNWGVCCLPLTTGLGLVVSLMYYLRSPSEIKTTLPWYVKLYWVACNMMQPTAVFITIFYWSIIFETTSQPVSISYTIVDVSTHAVNSCVMIAQLLSSRLPLLVLHVLHPLALGIVYNLFSVLYWAVGGTDVNGNPWIYEVVNWNEPGPTMLILLFSLGLFVLIHIFLVGLTQFRDFLGRCIYKGSKEDVMTSLPLPLKNPPMTSQEVPSSITIETTPSSLTKTMESPPQLPKDDTPTPTLPNDDKPVLSSE